MHERSHDGRGFAKRSASVTTVASVSTVASAPTGASAPALRLRGLTKRFGDITANNGVSLDAWPGEVHCLLGENGAGKSTLIAMLAGMQRPDEGQIEIAGQPVAFSSPAEALALGVGVVYQHSILIPSMSVIENLMLAQPGGLMLDRRTASAHLSEFNRSSSVRIDPHAFVANLSLGQRQQLEIAKVMWAMPRVLVLDEATSMLAEQAVEDLMTRLRELAVRGVAVILITHKLDEAFAIGDRITVLRAGRVVMRHDNRDAASGEEDRQRHRQQRHEQSRNREQLREKLRGEVLQAMFGARETHRPDVESKPSIDGGEDVVAVNVTEQPATADPQAEPGTGAACEAPRPPILQLDDVSTAGEGSLIHRVSLSVGAGEILGVAGIDGHGQRHLAEVIAGQLAPESGQVLLDGENITGIAVRGRQRLGVRYLSDDRLHEGIAPSFSVALNLLLKRIGERPFWRFGRTRRADIDAHAKTLIEQYDIRPADPWAPSGTLSGGNIQKVLLARELEGDPKVVVFNKPSYGLDLRTVKIVHENVRGVARAGAAVVLLSTDLDELAALAHRVAVISAGRLSAPIENDTRLRERIGALIASGSQSKEHTA